MLTSSLRFCDPLVSGHEITVLESGSLTGSGHGAFDSIYTFMRAIGTESKHHINDSSLLTPQQTGNRI